MHRRLFGRCYTKHLAVLHAQHSHGDPTALVLRMVSKGYNVARWLSRNKWIYKRGGKGSWGGYQDKVQREVLHHKTTADERSDGTEKVTAQVRANPKGLVYLSGAVGR